jgi:hypothetical protein
MDQALKINEPNSFVIESVILQGDLSKLTSEQRGNYVAQLCNLMGLNPLTKPFEFMNLQGKLVCYAGKNCAEQLRKVHNVSLKVTAREKIDDIYVVTVDATLPNGRTDSSTGAVPLKGLQGDQLANALMKAETKAKRRATLSICSLGMLDETEVETIQNPHAAKNNQPEADDGIQIQLPACEGCKTQLKYSARKSDRYPDGVWYCPNFKNKDFKHDEPIYPDEYEKWKGEILAYAVQKAKESEQELIDFSNAPGR